MDRAIRSAIKRDPPPCYVEVEHGGLLHVGTYTVDRGVITVDAVVSTRTTQVGGASPAALARTLLRALVTAGR